MPVPRLRSLTAAAAVLTGLAAAALPAAPTSAAEPAISMERVVVPMVFPVVGGASYTDTFLACRDGCARKHLGLDLMAPKMRPLVATFNGTISSLRRETRVGDGNYVSLRGDNGWSLNYVHVNNDTPGTDDGKGTTLYSFAAGLSVGDRVFTGQLIGWVGDSGNAEGTGSHCHCELRKGDAWSGTVYNPKPSFDAAPRLAAPRVSGPHPDGSLIRSTTPGSPIYLVEAGRKRLVPAGVLAARGWTPAHVMSVNPNEVTYGPRGPDLPLPDGLVVRDDKNGRWLVSRGQRVPVPDDDALRALGVPAARIRSANAESLTATPLAPTPAPGARIAAPTVVHEGALLRVTDKPEVWVVENGLRRWIGDPQTLASWGFQWADVIVVPAATFDDAEVAPLGAPLPLRDGTVINPPTGGLHVVSQGRRRWISSWPAYKLFAWDRLPVVKPSAETTARLPVGAALP